MSNENFRPVARLDALSDDSAYPIEVDGHPILLCLQGRQVFAVSARCSHADQELACGAVRDGWIACPAHGARFDLETGEPLNPPATAPIATYPVRIVDEMVEIAV